MWVIIIAINPKLGIKIEMFCLVEKVSLGAKEAM